MAVKTCSGLKLSIQGFESALVFFLLKRQLKRDPYLHHFYTTVFQNNPFQVFLVIFLSARKVLVPFHCCSYLCLDCFK